MTITKHKIERINPKEAEKLINELDDYLSKLYPPDSNHLESIEKLSRKNVKMYGCKIDNKLVAIGVAKLMESYGELKRLYVSHHHRGEGLASSILVKLESVIKKNGLKYVRLETGIHQKEAIDLFKKMEYAKCDPFGTYTEDPFSIFMEKNLNKTNIQKDD
jgi:putative acetyltransferase